MKKLIFLLSCFLVLQVSTVQSQSYGFVEQECGIVPNSHYYCSTYQSGYLAWGLKLFHNGTIILQMDGINIGESYSCDGFKFINDSTGFFMYTHHLGGFMPFLCKIVGNNVINLGQANRSYVLNEHTVYIVKRMYGPQILKWSDVQPSFMLVNDSLAASDTTVIDTLVYMPLCDSLSELNFKFDTNNYKILFYIKDSLYTFCKQNVAEWRIFPNPAEDYFHLKIPNSTDPCEIRIINSIGILKKSIHLNLPSEQTIYISDLEKGMYLIEINQKETRSYFKMIKI